MNSVEKEINVKRFSIVSSKPFEAVVAAIDAAVGHPDLREFGQVIATAPAWADVEAFILKSLGSSGFMAFIRFDLGAVLRKESGASTPKNTRFVIGNPLIMKEMAKHVPDTGSWAPVSILIDERADGVHLSWDSMASLLAPYGSPEASEVARNLDAKIRKMLSGAAA